MWYPSRGPLARATLSRWERDLPECFFRFGHHSLEQEWSCSYFSSKSFTASVTALTTIAVYLSGTPEEFSRFAEDPLIRIFDAICSMTDSALA